MTDLKTTHFTYILYNKLDPSGATYNGYTTNPYRRQRQHNAEIKGGARFTTSRSKAKKAEWDFLMIVTSPMFTKQRALSFEWSTKYPTNHRPRPKEYQGARGRIKSLVHLFSNPKFADLTEFTVWAHPDYIADISEVLQPFDNTTTVLPLGVFDTTKEERV